MDYVQTRVLDVSLCGSDIVTVRLRKPEDYQFTPGQYFMLRPPGDVGAKPFSHAAAPSDPILEMTTRLSGSPFKNSVALLRPGDTVAISKAAGRFGLSEGITEVVFLTGGVGITPVRSILRDADIRATGLRPVVLFGNRDESCIPYRAELDALAATGGRVVHVLQFPGADWSGESGFITPELIERSVADIGAATFVISGPPPMVEAMESCLDRIGVPRAAVIIERFSAPS
jgi:ferredoxin-NADP reductase